MNRQRENGDSAAFRYGVYTRKSSEYEDSQIQSIQRQIDELSHLIEREDLVVYREFLTESRSAFHPGREEFSKLVEWTEQGRINAWICWHANRLSRNPVDTGTIIYLMDQGKLHHIRTRDRVFYNTPDDKMVLQVELTFSKKDSDDKSRLVKSGILRRHRRGYPNGLPPVGFMLRDRGRSGQSFWVVDPKRFPLVRKVFARYLEGHHSLRGIHTFAAAVGLTTPARKVLGGSPLSLSSIHRTLLGNPVYAGFFFGTDGQRYTLDESLPRVITEEEYARIQGMLGKRNANPWWRPGGRAASYRGIISCPEGHRLTVDLKSQLICDCRRKFAHRHREECPGCGRRIDRLKNPTYLEYSYYFAARLRRRGETAPSIEEREIDRFMVENVARPIAIAPQLRDWAIAYLEESHDKELRDRRKEAKLIEEARRQRAMKRKRLRDLFISGQITEEEYQGDMAELDRSADEEETALALRGDWMEDARKVLNLAVEMEQVLTFGSPEHKNQALRHLRSNLTWDGQKLSVFNGKTANILLETLNLARAENPAFEPENCVDTSGSNEVFESVRPTLCRGMDAIRTYGGPLSTGADEPLVRLPHREETITAFRA